MAATCSGMTAWALGWPQEAVVMMYGTYLACRQVQRQAEYDEALVVLKAKLKRQEEFGMREQMQEKVGSAKFCQSL